jgi:hypothetical protein
MAGDAVYHRNRGLLYLDARPWADIDCPSSAGCAAALQLLLENIPCLLRAQRLASIGAALPRTADAPPLSPSRLRAVPKHPLIAGEAVPAQEDPGDEVYVEEVAFHGGSRLVLLGLTNHSAHTARVLLNAIFASAGDGSVPGRHGHGARQHGRRRMGAGETTPPTTRDRGNQPGDLSPPNPARRLSPPPIIGRR